MLEAVNLTKRYGRTLAVDDVSFSIGKGETIGLIGRNGAGKSSVMRMLAGYIAPSGGRVMVDGVDMADDHITAARRIGYMPETPPLYLDLTVWEHIMYVASLRGIRGRRARGETERVCGAAGVSDVRARLIRNLSKGYRQRVGFASAMVGAPGLIILDEPTAGLDPGQIADLRELVASLSRDASFVISSHILPEISSMCSRIMILHRGRLAEDGSPEEIARRHSGPPAVDMEITGPPDEARDAVARAGGVITSEERLAGGVTRFRIAIGAPDAGASEDGSLALRRAVFKAVAGGRGLAIVAMRPVERTLEDVFIGITERAE
ncbi:MAG: ABC transporter ATP-binding protein [Synergistaceae bacterium]|jgi:ABC-2 type transport system ATP-binding protein|nr:ABC transporter ATP-binding protein [Synergistaceae bacterium]